MNLSLLDLMRPEIFLLRYPILPLAQSDCFNPYQPLKSSHAVISLRTYTKHKAMIKHTLKILWNERKHNIVITLELLLIAVVYSCVVDVVYCTLRNYYSPTGFDIENTFVMHLQELPERTR